MTTSLIEEVIVIIIVKTSELGLGIDMTTQRFSVSQLLQGIQTAGNTLISVGVKCVEIDRSSPINAGIQLGRIQNDIVVGINDTRLGSGVGIDKVCILVSDRNRWNRS